MAGVYPSTTTVKLKVESWADLEFREVVDDRDQEPLVVTVDAAGDLYLNIGDDPQQPVAGDQLVQRIAAVQRRQPGKRVLVRGDHSVDYGTVIRALVLLQQADIPMVGLVTEPPDT